jgi:hypothetical protein
MYCREKAAEHDLKLSFINEQGVLMQAHIVLFVNLGIFLADLIFYGGVLTKATQITFRVRRN